MKLELILLGYLIFQSLDIWVIFQQKEYHNIQLSALLVHDACIMHIPSPQPPRNNSITIHFDVSHVYDVKKKIRRGKTNFFLEKYFLSRGIQTHSFDLRCSSELYLLANTDGHNLEFYFPFFLTFLKNYSWWERFGLRQSEGIKNGIKEAYGAQKTKAKKMWVTSDCILSCY